MKIRGRYKATLLENGLVVAEREIENLVTTVGVNHLLDVVFGGAVASNLWYIGLINNIPTPALSAIDTLVSHGGWVELNAYTGNRQEWVDAASVNRAKASSVNASFAINATVTAFGLFLCNVATGTTGVLFSEGAFATALPMVSGQTLDVVLTIDVL